MKFEYNGNLLEDERINLVAKEIVDKYPVISMEKAADAAMLEGKISKDKTVYDVLNRLYNIMLVNCENKNIVMFIYKDFVDIIKDNHVEDDKYIYLSDGIANYLQNYNEFPLLSDYE